MGTFTWTPDVAKATDYKIYARWLGGSGFSTAANYIVHHAAGASTVPLDQTQSSNVWVLLGTYALAPGSNHWITLDNSGSNGYVTADAVKLELADPQPGNFTADNVGGTTTGTGWITTTSLGNGFFWGINAQYVPENDPTASFNWEPAIPVKKCYSLFAQ